MADNDYYHRLSEMNPGELADGLAMEAEFDAIGRGFAKLPAPHRDGQGFEGPVRVGDATNPDEAINKGQLDNVLGTAKQLAVVSYGNFNAAAWGTLPSGTYLLFGTGSQITNSPFTLVAAKTYYFAVHHAIGTNLYFDSVLMSSTDDSAHVDIGREAWRVGPTLAVASAGWKAALIKNGDTVMGDLFGITAPQFANDTKLATTAFVQRALGNFREEVVLSAASTLTAADVGRLFVVTSPTAVTTTLPLGSTVPSGATITFYGSNAPNGWTVRAQGADILQGGSGNAVVLGIGDSCILENTGGGTWRLVGGSLSLKSAAVFGASLAINGYQKLPNGMIIQWGAATSSGTAAGNAQATFPLAFPTQCVVAVAAISNAGSAATYTVQVGAFTQTTLSLSILNGSTFTNGTAVRWIAIGF